MSDDASEEKDSKDELDRLIEGSKAKGPQLINLTGNILRWSQETIDLSDASAKVVQTSCTARIEPGKPRLIRGKISTINQILLLNV